MAPPRPESGSGGSGNPPSWSLIGGLFTRAAELDPAERDAFLDRECADEPRLREEIEKLLAADSHPESPLDEPALQPAMKLLLREGANGLVGRRIGPYEIQYQLGAGGMGTVYLALRADDEYDQKVALKLIQRGLETETAVTRFRRERQILARLNHPNIARLLDGGSTGDGRPFLAMEYVEGERIDHYCDRLQLDVRERLELFLPICSAVHFAHQQLIVHRDLKPSNVLVTAEGIPKLLDFGIAKLLDPGPEDPMTPRTATEVRAMTPRYASPEQMTGDTVTTATDVYGLGTLLYELLIGQPVHPAESGSRAAMAWKNLEAEIQKPSQGMFRDSGGSRTGAKEPVSAESIARARSSNPTRLRRRLVGDLDRIVLKALRKEPERRYGSAGQLSEDIRRHQAGLPVLARRDTFGYRAGKFLRRHRAGTAVACLLFLAALTFSLAFARQAQRTERERDRAEFERAKAQKVSTFLVDLFDLAGAGTERSQRFTARNLIDMGAKKIRREYQGQPEVQATLLQALGTGYRKMGAYDQAEPLLREALDVRIELLGADHLDTATSLEELGMLSYDLGRYTEAEPLFARASEIRETALGPEDPAVGKGLLGLVSLQIALGDYADAEAIARRSLEILRSSLGPESLPVSEALNGLANAQRFQGDYENALASFDLALKTRRKIQQADHPDLASILHNLGSTLQISGDVEGALTNLRQALEISERGLGPDHPNVAASLQTLGMIHTNRAEYGDAEVYLRRSLEVFATAFGDQHLKVAVATNNLGVLYYRQGDLAQAATYFSRATEIYKEAAGPEHALMPYSLIYLGAISRQGSDFAAAESYFERALAIWRKSLPPNHSSFGRTFHQLALLHRDRGDQAKAIALLLEALDIFEEAYGNDHRHIASALHDLAEIHIGNGRIADAAELGGRALSIRQSLLGPDHPDTRASGELMDGLATSG